jgi:hypothetical protein
LGGRAQADYRVTKFGDATFQGWRLVVGAFLGLDW